MLGELCKKLENKNNFCRPSVLEDILNDLFQILRLETCQNLKLALEVHLRAMKRSAPHTTRTFFTTRAI